MKPTPYGRKLVHGLSLGKELAQEAGPCRGLRVCVYPIHSQHPRPSYWRLTLLAVAPRRYSSRGSSVPRASPETMALVARRRKLDSSDNPAFTLRAKGVGQPIAVFDRPSGASPSVSWN